MKLVPKFSDKPIREIVPGKDVSVSITMSPLATPCDQARVIDENGACAPDALGWLIQPTPIGIVGDVDNTGHLWEWPYISASHDGDEANGHLIIVRLNTPPQWSYTSYHGDQFLDRTWLFYGVPYGDAVGIRWEWTISEPTLPTERPETPTDSSWWEGVEIEQVGQFVQVRILSGYVDGYMIDDDWRANIYATAFCGDTEIGVLEIELFVNKYY